MAILLSPIGNSVHYVDSDGKPLSGAQLFIYTAGASAKVATFKDSLGTANNTNPIILKGDGSTPYPVWLNSDALYKFVLAPASDIDPPTSAIWSIDNISPVNDVSANFDQWVVGPTPSFVSATSFSLVGDQTSNFHIGRRVKISQSGATVYGTITGSAFSIISTIDVSLDSGVIDTGIDGVWYALLTAENYSVPFGAKYTAIGDLLYASAPKIATVLPIGNDGQLLSVTASPDPIPSYWAPAGYRNGLKLTNGITNPTSDITIATGEVTDTTAGYILKLIAGITKQIDNVWAEGDNLGGMFTGSLVADTWYHVFLIRKDSDGTIDAGFDADIDAANIPTGYTAYQRLGSVLTDATPDILGFQQFKDMFVWNVPILDFDGISVTARTALAISVPLGVEVYAKNSFYLGSPGGSIYISHPDTDSVPPSDTVAPLATISHTTITGSATAETHVDKNSVITYWTLVSANPFRVATVGWKELW